MKRSRSFILLAAALGAVLTLPLAARPAASVAQANPAGGHGYHFPFIVRPEPTPTPTPTPTTPPVIIVNPSFEDKNWFTDYPNGGSQHPAGWSYFAPAKEQPMLWPTKGQEGGTVPAISSGPGENVHKLWEQLPEHEYPGTPCSLLLDGEIVYKSFKDGPHALSLSQTLTGVPGNLMRVTGYISGETRDQPTGGNTKLEDDHFRARVKLGAAADDRMYLTMHNTFDVPGNGRPWNRFSVTTVVPPSGQLLLEVWVQQNWPGHTDFFLDHFSAEQWNPAFSMGPAAVAAPQSDCIK